MTHHAFVRRCIDAGSRGHDEALRAFARTMHGCAEWTARHLEVALTRLPDPTRQQPLQRRLARELGWLDDEDCRALRAIGIAPTAVLGRRRADLAADFARAVGVPDHELATPSFAAETCRTRLLLWLRQATPARAIGAVVLGVDAILGAARSAILTTLLARGDLRRPALAWFEVPAVGVARHREDLLLLVSTLARTPGGRDDLAAGRAHAASLHRELFDRLHAATRSVDLARTA